MRTLDKATILIKGASSGFGREMVKQFLQKNGRLTFTDIGQTALAAMAQSKDCPRIINAQRLT